MYLYDIQGCVCKIYKDVYVSLVMQLCNMGLTVLLKIPSTTAISSKILPPHSAYIKTFPRCHQGGMAPPRVGTTVGAWSPKRGHQVLTRDLCPGMLPAVRAVCRWQTSRSRDGVYCLCRATGMQTPGALRLLVHPLVLLCPGAAVGLCAPRSPWPGTGCPPTSTPKYGSTLARRTPSPAHPGPCHEETAKGSPCPSQGRNRSPGAALRPPPTTPPPGCP